MFHAMLTSLFCLAALGLPQLEPITPAQRVWIDTDPACDGRKGHDPDDCLALYALGRSARIEIIGVSATSGNVNLKTASSILYGFLVQARAIGQSWPDASAAQDICAALAEGPMQIIALGPMTNIAAALQACPQHAHRITRVVFVGGRRAGHVFHPAEGARRKASFGHGPIFRDLNVAKAPAAVSAVLSYDVPIWLTPYELARQYTLTQEDLTSLAQQDDLAAELSQRSVRWLSYWRTDIGRDGFYPFDLMAVAAVLSPTYLDCPPMRARMKRDTKIGGLTGPLSLIIDDEIGASKGHTVRACVRIKTGGEAAIRALLIEDIQHD